MDSKFNHGVTLIAVAMPDAMSSLYQVSMFPGLWFPAST